MANDQAGTGKVPDGPSTKPVGAKTVEVNEVGFRDGFTRRTYTTPCGAPQYGPGLSGGDKERFEELKRHQFGSFSKEVPFDSDYDITKTQKALSKPREPDKHKDEDDNRDYRKDTGRKR